MEAGPLPTAECEPILERSLQIQPAKDLKKNLDLVGGGGELRLKANVLTRRKGKRPIEASWNANVPLNPTPSKLRQEDCRFGDSLGYIVRYIS